VRWGVHRGTHTEIEISSGRERIAKISAEKILFATNGLSLPLSGLEGSTFPKLTLAALTEPLAETQIEALGLAGGSPFYTVDFPYLWGRLRPDNSIVLGAGLVDPSGSATSGDPSKSPELLGGHGHRSSHVPRSHDLTEVRITDEAPARLFEAFHTRIRGLHTALATVEFTHHWGGPILFRQSWKPVFGWHPESGDGGSAHDAIVIGAFAGHGVALSSFLGAWAAEVFLGKRTLPRWGAIGK
jgi:glycine/D-amino acid oxidase-like deaminating enzyme